VVISWFSEISEGKGESTGFSFEEAKKREKE
jgi:hypothetical protein